MKASVIIAVVILLLIAYYFLVANKTPQPLSVFGYADNDVTLLLNDEKLLYVNDWTKRFKWDGMAKSGDKLSLVVRNLGDQAGLVCALNWNGKMIYSDPSTFQTTTPVNSCSDTLVARWSQAVTLTGMEQAKWIWGNGCVDGSASPSNPVVNTFTYVLP